MPARSPKAVRAVLDALLVGGVVMSVIPAPGAAGVLAKILAKRLKKREDSLKTAIEYTLGQKWTEWRETADGSLELRVTGRGRKHWQKIQLDQPLSAPRWDRRWRLVMFDVPTRRKNSRDSLRLGLKRLGLKQLQESVWVTPYDCQKEISLLKSLYKVEPYVTTAIVSGIEAEQKLLKQFNLKR